MPSFLEQDKDCHGYDEPSEEHFEVGLTESFSEPGPYQ